MITYDDLKKMNDLRKENFKNLLDNANNQEEQILLKSAYKFKFIKNNGHKNLRLENNIEKKNSYPTSFLIDSLSSLLYFYETNSNFFISNFSVLDDISYLNMLQKYKLDQNCLSNITSVLSNTSINLFKIERVKNIKEIVAKFVLKGSIINSFDNNIYFIKDNNNYYLISEYIIVINYLNLSYCDIKTVMFSDIEFSNSKTFLRMFSGCENLEKVVFNNLYLTYIDTMRHMFSNCDKLKYVDFGNINTSNIEYFDNMFFNCTSLKYLNLNNLNVSNAINFNYMFANCINLVDLKINNWVLNKNKILSFVGMFENCIKLKNCKFTFIDSIRNKSNFRNDWNKDCPLFEVYNN